MLMADTLAVFLVILGLMLALPALWLLSRALWPGTVASAAGRCKRGLSAGFLIGLPITLMVVLTTAILFNLMGPIGKMAGAALICLFMVYAHTGVAGLATAMGERLSSPVDEMRPWRATLRGGIVLELTYLIPILGWFIILPLSIIIGSGTTTLVLMSQLRERFSLRPGLAPAPAAAEAASVGTGSATVGATQ